jgi:hypothetical protein
MTDSFSPREFLRSRSAVLVHFSTVMTARSDLAFPHDLLQAMALRGPPLSFSTILIGDTNPFVPGGRRGAEGSVGMIVDIVCRTRILSVWPRDSGGGDGWPPVEQNCAASIDQRQRGESNEWNVRDYEPIGIFILSPIRVRLVLPFPGQPPTPGEVEIDLQNVIDQFPAHRIFSVNDHTFLEWDRHASRWNPVAYNDIIPI